MEKAREARTAPTEETQGGTPNTAPGLRTKPTLRRPHRFHSNWTRPISASRRSPRPPRRRSRARGSAQARSVASADLSSSPPPATFPPGEAGRTRSSTVPTGRSPRGGRCSAQARWRRRGRAQGGSLTVNILPIWTAGLGGRKGRGRHLVCLSERLGWARRSTAGTQPGPASRRASLPPPRTRVRSGTGRAHSYGRRLPAGAGGGRTAAAAWWRYGHGPRGARCEVGQAVAGAARSRGTSAGIRGSGSGGSGVGAVVSEGPRGCCPLRTFCGSRWKASAKRKARCCVCVGNKGSEVRVLRWRGTVRVKMAFGCIQVRGRKHCKFRKVGMQSPVVWTCVTSSSVQLGTWEMGKSRSIRIRFELWRFILRVWYSVELGNTTHADLKYLLQRKLTGNKRRSKKFVRPTIIWNCHTNYCCLTIQVAATLVQIWWYIPQKWA